MSAWARTVPFANVRSLWVFRQRYDAVLAVLLVSLYAGGRIGYVGLPFPRAPFIWSCLAM